jgi:transposase
MFGLSEKTRVFVKPGATDGRLGLDALRGLVTHVLKQEVLSGSIFTFCNQRRNRIRCLFFDGSGFWLATKRLEGAMYQWPKDPAAVMQMSVAQLRLLMEGFELRSRRGWRRYEHRLAPGSPSAEAIATRGLKTPVDPQ